MIVWLNLALGLTFLALALANTLLMYRLWGYAYDHEANRSSAPRWLVLVHRATGYVFVLIYIYLMSEMLPRLWQYQIELPARSVMHLILGFSIGMILIIKISIVRFFKHMEASLVPMLGTGLLICVTLLIGLSAPFVFKEQYLSQQALGTVLSEGNLERLKTLLPRAGYPPQADLNELASVDGLQTGRRVLLSKCVQCHDLRTVLVRPKTPEAWLQTVNRMADRAVIGKPIEERERWHVAAYLVAISPDLQQAAQTKREQELKSEEAIAAVRKLPAELRFEPAAAKQVFEAKCVQCHALPKVDAKSTEEIKELVARMAGNGLVASVDEFAHIVFHLSQGLTGASDAPPTSVEPAPAPKPATDSGKGY
jgi:mono/diheme cytochrome c family protein